jgi:hypothetical protein
MDPQPYHSEFGKREGACHTKIKSLQKNGKNTCKITLI